MNAWIVQRLVTTARVCLWVATHLSTKDAYLDRHVRDLHDYVDNGSW